jgi:DNA-binding LytR/AlgR family response regulator
MADLQQSFLKPIVLKTPLGFDYFDFDEIIMIEANGNSSNVYRVDRDRYERVLHNLTFIEVKYSSAKLFRCHKSFIINTSHIEALMIKDHKVVLKNGLEAPLSEKCLKIMRQLSSIL